MRAEEAAAAGDEDRVLIGFGSSQSTRPIHRSRFSAYQRIVLQDSLVPAHLRLPAGLAVQLLVADAEGHHLGRARAVARLGRDHVPAGGPEAVRLADLDDLLRPVRHRDVLALPVDVDVAGDALRGDGQVAAHAVGAEAEVAQRVELAELDLLALERLRDDRPGHVARVLARPVVVEHARDDSGQAERVEVVHRQEVGGHLRGRVDRLRVDRRALVQDQAARVVVVVVVLRPTRADCRTPRRCRRCRTSRSRGPWSTIDWSRLSVPTVFAITVS